MPLDTVDQSIKVHDILPEDTANRLRGAIYTLGYSNVKEAAEDCDLDYQMLIKQLNRRYVVTEPFVDQYREWLDEAYPSE